MIVSPALTRLPETSSRRSESATQKPARSNSSGSIMSGCSAVSPPRSAQPASRQPSTMPSTSSATTSTLTRPHVITSMKNAGRAPAVITSFTLIATRSMPSPAWRPAARPSSTFVPTPSHPAAISGSPTDGV